MKPPALTCALFFSLTSFESAFSQSNPSLTATQINEKVMQALADHDQLHYKAQMRFTYFGADTPEVRNFNVQYRANPASELYGYDWAVGECFDHGTMFTMMVVQDQLFSMYDSMRIVNQAALSPTLNVGTYDETMRHYFVLQEIYAPFVNAAASDIAVVDSNGRYYLSMQTQPWARRNVVINQQTFLPEAYSVEITDGEPGLTQLQEIDFIYDHNSRQLPDTSFSIDHLVSIGYTHKLNPPPPPDQVLEKLALSTGEVNVLFDYPFLEGINDTAYLEKDDQYILLDFWFISCLPCMKAMPEVNALAAKYADKGLRVYGINGTDKAIMESVMTKLRAKRITIPLYFADPALLNAIGVRAFPTYVLISSGGAEEIEGGVEGVKKVLRNLLGE